MSHLAINQLSNNDQVDINVRFNESKTLYALRVKLYKHNVIPDGDFKITILDGATVLAESTLTYADFAQVTGTFAYGYFKFDLPYSVRVNVGSVGYQDITFRMTVSNHTNSDNAFIALVKQHELKYITEFGTYPVEASTLEEQSWYSPYGLELYTLTNN